MLAASLVPFYLREFVSNPSSSPRKFRTKRVESASRAVVVVVDETSPAVENSIAVHMVFCCGCVSAFFDSGSSSSAGVSHERSAAVCIICFIGCVLSGGHKCAFIGPYHRCGVFLDTNVEPGHVLYAAASTHQPVWCDLSFPAQSRVSALRHVAPPFSALLLCIAPCTANWCCRFTSFHSLSRACHHLLEIPRLFLEVRSHSVSVCLSVCLSFCVCV